MTVRARILVLLISAAVCACSGNAWKELTASYVTLDEKMLQAAAGKDQAWAVLYEERNEIGQQLASISAPPPAKLVEYMNSKDKLRKKMALATLMIKKTHNRELVKEVIQAYKTDDEFMAKFYAMQYLASLDQSVRQGAEDPISRILESERSGPILIALLPIIAGMRRDRATRLFIRYLEMGDPGVRRATSNYIATIDNHLLEEIPRAIQEKENR